MLRLLPLGAIAGALVCARPAAAAPTARLVYSRGRGAESCPDEATLRRAVAARVGYDPFFPWAQRTVVANIEGRDREFIATVSLVDEQGVGHGGRQLRTTGDCAELLDAAALAIAIAIDPAILSNPPAVPSPEPARPTPAAAAVPTARVAPPPASFPPPARVRTPPGPSQDECPGAFETTLGAVASMGAAPDIAAGLSAGIQLRWCDVSLGLDGQANAPATRSAEAGGDVASWSVLGAIVPCAYFGPFLGCAIVQGGALRVSSSGLPDRKTEWTRAVAAGGRAGVVIPIAESAFVRVRSDWLANLDPVRLNLRGVSVWTAPPVESSLGIDVGLHFR